MKGQTPPKEKITAPQHLHRLITAALNGDADAALLALENACAAAACEPSDVLQAPGAEDVLEPAERKELQEHLQVAAAGHVQQAAAAVQAWTKQQRAARRRAQPEQPASGTCASEGPNPAPQQGVRDPAPAPEEGVRDPAPAPALAPEEGVADPAPKHWQAGGVEEGHQGQAVIQDFLPPHFRVSTDSRQGRWRVCSNLGFQLSKTFSWTRRGHHAAAELLLKWAWDMRAQQVGAACGADICPHPGLFT
jgi:hypothetical protein